ncbi:discoidin domain-containing protein [Sphingobacterium psychroaquaticum]|uniref:F5/8 type C domain-containing protein n=1 Tax=Sphingobacterium psychroaquaticum TaxID=561061 RepID=A0A1X7LCR8_9SPHI|nr:discoidin domain-containing protein [Sphingobacterium psychroaquaticum]SMG51052.1 F5/8 type C domain-containing protein [Sphingobacterium psychroaquaticum]
MKEIRFSFVAIGLLLLSSCIKDTLVFPEQVAKNEDKEPIDIIVKPTDVQIEGGYEKKFTFKWPVFSEKVEKVKVVYKEGTENKEIVVTDFSKNLILTTSDVGEFEFKLSSIGKSGIETSATSKKVKNKGLYIDDIINFVGASALDNNVVLEWSNPLTRGVEISIIHTTASGQKTEKINSTTEKGNFSFSGKYGVSAELQIRDSLGNVAKHTVNYGFSTTDLTTAAQKTGWTAAVSSNQSGDGGGAAALIDGATDTFWHSPYSGTVLPWPHHATLTLNKVRDLGGFILNLRHNNGSGAPKDFDFQTSTDGVNFVTKQSFVNTTVTNAAVLSYNLTTPVETKYVRLLFKTSVNNLAYLTMGEISLKERFLVIKP